VITALLGMMTMILSTLNERRREMAILRSVGAGPRTVVGLMVSEAGVLTFAGALLGIVLTYVGIMSARPLIDEWYGLYIAIQPPTRWELTAIGAIVAGGIIAGLLPAWRAYRTSLADGMRVRN
ncbi:MAG: FtsX-like permease family protein, partial [Pseudomonadota bacterium]